MDQMIIEIKNALEQAQVSLWSIETQTESSAELFFIRRSLDMRRMKDTVKYNVTVYRDFEKDGKAMRGSSAVCIVPSQSAEEIHAAVEGAYFAASFVANPTYSLPEAVTAEPVVMESDLTALTPEDAAMKMAEALFSAETGTEAVFNSVEVFGRKSQRQLLTSWGTDVGYTKYTVSGEFVVQCKQPEDVEMYHDFSYDRLDTEALKRKGSDALRRVADRAVAKQALPSGSYDLILSEDHVATILSYYVERTHAAMVFPGYSDWKPGSDAQGENVTGEKLNLTLHATVPFSDEGIPMGERPLIEDGKVSLIHGSSRLCSYLGVKPTGEYRSVICGNGTVPMEQLQSHPYLYPVAFSDFQMDTMSGHFGGEIRLAYWFDGKETRIVTGGSVNGSIMDCCGKLRFSLERYSGATYQGPLAVLMPAVPVAGTV